MRDRKFQTFEMAAMSESEAKKALTGEWRAIQYTNSVVGKNKLPGSEEMIPELHKRIMTPLMLPEYVNYFAGKYRVNDVWLLNAGVEIPPARQIPGLMEEYFNKTDHLIKQLRRGAQYVGDFLDTIASIHYDFAILHPYVDGNGRTARQFTNLVCKEMGVRTIVLGPVHKNGYLDALDKVNRTDNIDHLTIFLATRLWNAYKDDHSHNGFVYREYINSKIVELSNRIYKMSFPKKVNHETL